MAVPVILETKLKDLLLMQPKVYEDERGYFMESFSQRDYETAGLGVSFVQDNESMSAFGTLRGLHFQKKNPQGKLVRVIFGEVFDVALDLRKNSKTFGQWEGFRLSGRNKLQLYVPEGFAHGFLVLSSQAILSYKCTRHYSPQDEGGIRWNDRTISIEWPISDPEQLILSKKDQDNPLFHELDELF